MGTMVTSEQGYIQGKGSVGGQYSQQYERFCLTVVLKGMRGGKG